MRVNGIALATDIASRVVPAYRKLGELSFVYGQGSVVVGFTTKSDLDLVFVWDRDEPPDLSARPAGLLNEGARAPVQYHQPGFYLDRFWMGGRQVDVPHVPRSVFDDWLRAVMAGGGWERREHPLPLAAVAGFAYGVILSDDGGTGAAARAEVAAFPTSLVERSRALLAEQLPEYEDVLDGCARRGDGWLFHEVLADGLRYVFVSWFAAEHRYWPHHKWLQRWVERFGMDQSIADLERQLWAPGADLARKQELFSALANRVLGLPRP